MSVYIKELKSLGVANKTRTHMAQMVGGDGGELDEFFGRWVPNQSVEKTCRWAGFAMGVALRTRRASLMDNEYAAQYAITQVFDHIRHLQAADQRQVGFVKLDVGKLLQCLPGALDEGGRAGAMIQATVHAQHPLRAHWYLGTYWGLTCGSMDKIDKAREVTCKSIYPKQLLSLWGYYS